MIKSRNLAMARPFYVLGANYTAVSSGHSNCWLTIHCMGGLINAIVTTAEYTTKRDEEIVRTREMDYAITEFFAFQKRMVQNIVGYTYCTGVRHVFYGVGLPPATKYFGTGGSAISVT
ncbi:hypothetical protein BC938DRAFT_476190 [Jimgerdemannia flammicorona]|uniref:Uncharacterized protein n=1 Tax=Jimgerdemannia flammicorona TaxID=994334 RepID=A0A433PJG1_9FUNG|nr:hypothetical protein BC938DRAFT_476190 [Jimgerdemannia flammicorona]